MKITQEHEKCIGCGNCAALCPKYWEMSEDGKAIIPGGKKDPQTGNYEMEITNIECNQEAADSCPVNIIHIVK